jgi:putative endonuclease
MWYLYVLKCSDKSFYTGITIDIKRRLKQHNQGKGSKYVRSRLPAKLVYSEWCGTRSKAAKRELEVKSLPRNKKIELTRRKQ